MKTFPLTLPIALVLPLLASASIPDMPLEISGPLISAPGDRAVGSVASERFSDAKATVVVFLSAKCPCSAAHEASLRQLHSIYAPKGLRFVALHANQDESLDATRTHFRTSALPFPVLEDTQAALANRLGALKTPHAFVISASGEVLFSGGVDDSKDPKKARNFYLADALRDVVDGRGPAERESRTLGCVIKR